ISRQQFYGPLHPPPPGLSMKKPLLLICVAVLTLVVGFWLGRSTVPPLGELEGPTLPGGRKSVLSARKTAGSKLSVEEIATRLENECRRGIWHRTKEWETIFNALTGPE